MKAMILAAGLGTRLRPCSLVRPKPLFPVLGRPLLLGIIDRLQESGFQSIVVNCHHLADQLLDLIVDLPGIVVQHEKSVLGTGGALRKALPNFGGEPFLVVNADIYHEIDYQQVYAHHLASRNLVTMVLHDYPRFNKVHVDTSGRILGFSDKQQSTRGVVKQAFTGVQVVHPDALSSIPEEQFSSSIDQYQKILNVGGRIGAMTTSAFWSDIGRPEDYLQLHQTLLRDASKTGHLHRHGATDFFVHGAARLGKNVRLVDWGMIGRDAVVGENVSLERVVVWDGVFVPDGGQYRDTILC